MAAAPETAPEAPPHVRVRGDALEIDGRPTFLFGGELQYFRVRDPGWDAARTHRIWAERLDQLKAAGANFLTTYVPWDFHEPERGRFVFDGARDLPRFLDLAVERGFRLCLKPGPNILAEWPYGFTYWGAIPTWWKRSHPAELVRDRTGEIFRWHPLFPSIGASINALPSLASERFRAATERWIESFFDRVARPYFGSGKPLVAIQLDNETNNFWSDVYRIDFNPLALARYRDRLRAKYGTPAALSDAYGRRYARFEDVRPPHKRRRGPAAAHHDWFDHQHALVDEWHGACRAMWARLGVNEPDVLFLTNDTHQTFPGRDFVLPNGVVKNRRALHALDTYPVCLPVPRSPRTIYDRPYEPDFHNKLNDVYNDLHLGPSRFAFGIEVQGGHLEIPLPFGATLRPREVTPAATTQTYLRLIAHGMKALAVYIAVGGLNLDGTRYDCQAAIGLDGTLHPRYEGLSAVGRLIRNHERELLESAAVESPVAVVASARALGPGYGYAGEQRIFGDELRACFGWLVNAGFTPRVLDLELATEEDLRACRALVFPTSGRFDEAAAAKLERFVARGGTLVQGIARGPLARSLFRAEVAPRSFRRGSISSEGLATFFVESAGGTIVTRLRGVPRFAVPGDAELVLRSPGEEPFALGFARRAGEGRAVFLASLPTTCYQTGAYFSEPAGALDTRAFFVRRLLAGAGVRRLFAFDAVREECHARYVASTGALFLFAFSSHAAGTTTVRLRSYPALQLAPERRYVVEDVFSGDRPRLVAKAVPGASLHEDGIPVPLGDGGCTVLRVRPA